MAELLYQGHGSFRLIGSDGLTVYVDPYAGEGYDLPADVVLVTHQHHDHNQVDLMPHIPGCAVYTQDEALRGGTYNTLRLEGFHDFSAEAVQAYNLMHRKNQCVGYIVTIDGKTAYFSGDTSRTQQMDSFAARGLDYAFLCCDGHFNMGLKEAAECARIIGAKHTVPIHMKPGALFDQALADKLSAPGKLILRPGEKIEL